MFDAIINNQGDLLVLHFSDAVDAGQMDQCVELVRGLISGASPGFTVIADLGGLTHMDYECAQELGVLMDLFNRARVARVCRVIPNPDVDIGWNILSKFHYDPKSVEIHTFPFFFQAMKVAIGNGNKNQQAVKNLPADQKAEASVRQTVYPE